MRLATLIVVEAVINTAKPAQDGSSGKKVLNYAFIDVYSKLVIVLLKHMNGGGTEEQIVAQRMALLNKVLGVTVRTLMWDYHTRSQKSRSLWDQRPWFRLLLNMTMDLNTPDPIFDPISFGILSAIGAAFHVVQPLAVPGKLYGCSDCSCLRAVADTCVTSAPNRICLRLARAYF
jgi:CCR4-NOT transcription complex subunit 1